MEAVPISDAGSLDQPLSPKGTPGCMFKTNQMRQFFPQYVLIQWNLLLQGAMEAKRLQKFKKGL